MQHSLFRRTLPLPAHPPWARPLKGAIVTMLMLLSALSGCEGCDTAPKPLPLVELIPAHAQAVLIVNNISEFTGGIDGFLGQATVKAGGRLLQRFRSRLKNELGFNPVDAAAFRKAGIEPERGLALFSLQGRPLLLVAVDPKRTSTFDKALAIFVEKLDGANKLNIEDIKVENTNLRINTIGRPFGDATIPIVRWTHVPGFALLSRPDLSATPSADFAQHITALRTERPKNSATPIGLGSNSSFSTLRSRLGKAQLLMFAQQNADKPLPWFSALLPLQKGAASMTALRISAEGLSIDVLAQVGKSTTAEEKPTNLNALLGEPPADLLNDVEEGAVVVALSRAGHKRALDALRNSSDPALNDAVEKMLARIKTVTGVDVAADIAPHAEGSITAAIYIDDVQGIVERIAKNLRNVRGLLNKIQLVLSAKLNNPDALWASLLKAQSHLKQRGISLSDTGPKKSQTHVRTMEPSSGSGSIGWGIVDNTYLYTAGPGRLQRALLFHGAPSETSTPASPQSIKLDKTSAAQALLAEKTTGVLIVRCAILADIAGSIKLGSGGFVIGASAILHNIAEILRTIGDVAISLRPEDQRLHLKIRQRYAH